MSMIPIIINNEVRQKIQEVIDYSWKHIVPIGEMSKSGKLQKGEPNPVGDSEAHEVIIPEAFRVVFSIDDQGTEEIMGKKGLGRCRHLSMSIGIAGRIPNPIAIDMVIEEFGFDHPLYHCIVWGEGFGDGTQIAINVLEPVDGWKIIDIDNEKISQALETGFENMFRPLFGGNLTQVIKNRRKIMVPECMEKHT